MNRFSIKDIENLSGIKAHTWRIWEQRYGISLADRKESNHRYYNIDNLKHILRISFLYQHGIKISKIATFDNNKLASLTADISNKAKDHQYYIYQLTEAAISLDEKLFESIFDEVVNEMGMTEAVMQVLYPFQEKIGVLWLTDNVIPSQEHFTSNILLRKLSVAINGLSQVDTENTKEVVLFTPLRERHEIPLLFIHYILKYHQVKVFYLGNNVSIDTLKILTGSKRISHLFFHLITNLTNYSMLEYIRKLRKSFPEMEIVVSGSQSTLLKNTECDIRLISNYTELKKFAAGS